MNNNAAWDDGVVLLMIAENYFPNIAEVLYYFLFFFAKL